MYGVLDAARPVWEELGIGPRRRTCPASKLACDEHGLAADVSWPAAKALALEPLDRARECRRRHLEALEPALFFRTADLFNADVDLRVWETTAPDLEIDDDGEPWRHAGLSERRPRRQPTPVVGLALTRAGLPVRSWGFPGQTAEVTTIDALKAAWRGWRLHRAVFGRECGRCSEANRPRLSRALGRYSLAQPMTGRALPTARDAHASQDPRDRPAGRAPPHSRYARAEEASGPVRRGQHYPPGFETGLPDPLCRLLMSLDFWISLSSHRKLGWDSWRWRF
jgi:hypothetical protein